LKSLKRFAIFACVVWVIDLFAHEWVPIPIGFWDLWMIKGSMAEGIGTVWFVFAWAILVNVIVSIVRIIRRETTPSTPAQIFSAGLVISFMAGIGEEISYRWIRYFCAMYVLALLNVCTWNIIRDVYVMFFMPVANWLTFGLLSEQLTNTNAWVLGAAILVSNGRFMEQHQYQGWFGTLNSWYIGMIFFFLALNYGLLTAILAHILYDIYVFSVASIGAKFLRYQPLSPLQILSNAQTRRQSIWLRK
jgi:hypothetical protein